MSGVFKPLELKQVIDLDYQNQIFDKLTSIEFPWHFLEDVTNEEAKIHSSPKNSVPGFVNLIYHQDHSENPYLDFFMPLVNNTVEAAGMKLDKLMRIRAGFLMNTKYMLPSMPYTYNTPHRDFDQEHYTAVYYVNNCDGDTVIFHETEENPPGKKYHRMLNSMPEKGKVCLFNGWHYHASSCPKMFTKRLAITMNFTVK
jgi:ectoine hydroxylase-related dioxygenase (phytanoyl-CoA dioxygenase family)